MALGVGAIVKSVAGLGQTWLEGKVAKTKPKQKLKQQSWLNKLSQ